MLVLRTPQASVFDVCKGSCRGSPGAEMSPFCPGPNVVCSWNSLKNNHTSDDALQNLVLIMPQASVFDMCKDSCRGKPGVGAACLTDTHLELLLKSPFLPGPNVVCRGRPGRSTVPSEPAARAAHSNSLLFLGLIGKLQELSDYIQTTQAAGQKRAHFLFPES
jgi:hypothetical protein